MSTHVVRDTANVYTPALLFYKDRIRLNIARCLEIAGSAERLRPHCKTHKTREVVRMQMEQGITKQKCATFAEAEMVASCGIEDVLIAYPLLGPNCGRFVKLKELFPGCRFSATVDHPEGAEALSAALSSAGETAGIFLDIDLGQHRTGIAAGPDAVSLYQRIAELPGLTPLGLHLYDGHNHQSDPAERAAAVQGQLGPVLEMRDALEQKGLPVPTLVAGGTPSFPIWAKQDLPGLECSPGTCLLHDNGYGTRFPDVDGFQHAALLLTRVISRPTRTRMTLDLGYKAVASDPPAGKRCVILDLEDYEMPLQNEEHLVIETPTAERFSPGDELYALPTHICPTCNLHQQAYVIEDGEVTEVWKIVGRDRVLTV